MAKQLTNKAKVEKESANRLVIKGVLDVSTVTEVFQSVREWLLNTDQECEIEFSKIGEVDSASIALILSVMRIAKKRNKTIKLTGIPDKMLAIAKLSSVDTLLPLASH